MTDIYKVLYTHQKNKKQGVIWKDGTAHVKLQEKRILLNDSDSSFVCSYRMKNNDSIEIGESVDVGKFLVLFDEVVTTTHSIPSTEQPPKEPVKRDIPKSFNFKSRGTFITPFSKKIKNTEVVPLKSNTQAIDDVVTPDIQATENPVKK
ncbi:hypothetical protein BB561_003370 [Smittium simulii]|uniref:5'-3' DNA helicase ZGRF1-like N-terminal domain-containing protein n=1 Tax=Smittium simulii TaxID=133385 RepID=A0A2T9YLR0_9FUNG|nr:hypothetical protein BB561_003370 [Smittium simulii]